MTQFIIAYDLREDATYTCKVDAPNWEAAERHLLAIASTGRVSGEWVMDVPQVDDTALLRQALEALEAVSDYQADMGNHRNAIAALRERLNHTEGSQA